MHRPALVLIGLALGCTGPRPTGPSPAPPTAPANAIPAAAPTDVAEVGSSDARWEGVRFVEVDVGTSEIFCPVAGGPDRECGWVVQYLQPTGNNIIEQGCVFEKGSSGPDFPAVHPGRRTEPDNEYDVSVSRQTPWYCQKADCSPSEIEAWIAAKCEPSGGETHVPKYYKYYRSSLLSAPTGNPDGWAGWMTEPGHTSYRYWFDDDDEPPGGTKERKIYACKIDGITDDTVKTMHGMAPRKWDEFEGEDCDGYTVGYAHTAAYHDEVCAIFDNCP